MPLSCASCRYENRLTADYCGSCGLPLPPAVHCPACGSANPPRQRFCDVCGGRLAGASSEEATPPQREAPAGEVAVTSGPLPLEVAPLVGLGAGATASGADAALATAVEPRRTAIRAARAYRTDAATIAALGLGLAFGLAMFVRVFRLNDIPATLAPMEEAFFLAARAIQNGDGVALWSEALGGQPAGLAYVAAGWTYLFGDSVASFRLLPAAASVATVAIFYLLCVLTVGRRAAVLGSLLLAFSIWHVTYSRLAAPMGLMLLAEVATAYLLFLALGEGSDPARRTRFLVLAGLSFGAGFYTHNAFLIFAGVIALFWVRELLAGEYPFELIIQKALLFAVPGLLVALPYLGFIAGSLPEPIDEVRGIGVARDPEYERLDGVPQQTRYILANIGRSAAAIFWSSGSGDEAGQRSRVSDPVTALLAAVGLFVAAWRLKRREYQFLWLVFATTVVAGGLTREAGVYGRLLVALPALFAAAGLAFDWLLTWMEGRVGVTAQYAFIAVLAVIVVVFNLAVYYDSPLGPGAISIGVGD